MWMNETNRVWFEKIYFLKMMITISVDIFMVNFSKNAWNSRRNRKKSIYEIFFLSKFNNLVETIQSFEQILSLFKLIVCLFPVNVNDTQRFSWMPHLTAQVIAQHIFFLVIQHTLCEREIAFVFHRNSFKLYHQNRGAGEFRRNFFCVVIQSEIQRNGIYKISIYFRVKLL